MAKKEKIKEQMSEKNNKMLYNSLSDKLLLTFCYVLVAVFSIICILPLWIALVASFTNEGELMRNGYTLFPSKIDFTAYKMVFTGTSSILNGYGVL